MTELLLYAAAGFVAQLIDGILGMGYGVTATSVLLAFGAPPALASASVHTAEVVTTGSSGWAHWRAGNVDWPFARKLMLPGIAGAIVGAYVLVTIPGTAIRPFVAAYLIAMGIVIIFKALRARPRTPSQARLVPLGLAGGFFDTIGGGGWGPIVVGTLLARGNEPRTTIGSVNVAEFFVTFAASATLLLTVGASNWTAIAGLALGGGIAAPISARMVGRIPARPLMIAVGITVILLSMRTLVSS